MWQRFAWGDLSMKANMTLVRYDADDNIGPGSYQKSYDAFTRGGADKNKNVFLKGKRKAP